MRWLRYRGATYLGPIRIPPLPARLILTDRTDGTLWLLTHDAETDYIGIDDAVSSKWTDVVVYPVGSEPYMRNEPRVRLIVQGGYLGLEQVELGQGVTDQDQGRVLTRRVNASETYEILAPDNWRPGDTLGYREVEF